MTDYERAVLRAIAMIQGYAGWHAIETRLSMVHLETREYLPTVLEKLTAEGLLEANPDGSGTHRLTPAGRELA